MTSAKDTRFPVCTLHLAFLLSFGLLGVSRIFLANFLSGFSAREQSRSFDKLLTGRWHGPARECF